MRHFTLFTIFITLFSCAIFAQDIKERKALEYDIARYKQLYFDSEAYKEVLKLVAQDDVRCDDKLETIEMFIGFHENERRSEGILK